MKVVILAGGLGTRLSEETDLKPKPMVEIGGKPILWHIMNIYAKFGFKEFVIALGYKGECKNTFSIFTISTTISPLTWKPVRQQSTTAIVRIGRSTWWTQASILKPEDG